MKQYRYFILSIVVLALDQITKLLIVKYVETYTVAWNLWGDFFRIIHVRNTGVAFSIGSDFPNALRVIFFIILPTLILIFVGIYIARSRELIDIQRWALSGIIGGGLGNQIDRIFRREGVVDFLDFKFYGIFGLERWPTFNIADSSLVISAILLMVLLVIQEVQARKL